MRIMINWNIELKIEYKYNMAVEQLTTGYMLRIEISRWNPKLLNYYVHI